MTTTAGQAPHGQPIRVLVVDDSAVIRRLVCDALSEDPEIEVVGQAKNGKVGVERAVELQPDAVTMDVEMPVMNGVEAVRALRRLQPRLPIVMFSTQTERGASATLDAHAAGASDYVTKPSNVASFAESQRNVREQLVPKLKALAASRRAADAGRTLASRGRVAPGAAGAPARPASPAGPHGRGGPQGGRSGPPARAPRGAPPGAVPAPGRPARTRRAAPFGLLVVGSSTGGPDALANVLPKLPGDLPVPVLVVQHMPPVFTRLLAQRLDAQSALSVAEATHGEPLRPGRALIAPGGFHLAVRRHGALPVAELTEDPPENFCRPAVDVLFRSAAAVYGDKVLGVVLTGMGRDGERGARVLRDAGGEVFAQDAETSVVWGMPGAVVGAGQADRVLPLPAVAGEVTAALLRGRDAVGVA